MSFHTQLREQLHAQLSTAQPNEVEQLNNALRLLSKWRSVLIQNTVLQHNGTEVWQGPLKGLGVLPQSTEGCHIAKLLGTYEQPLQPYIENAIATNYPLILNIGCAEGYYAVGMARKMPGTKVFAFDSSAIAQSTCTALAKKNNVSDRVQVGGLFSPSDFDRYSDGSRPLVLCDIEGAELELLDIDKAASLSEMDLIVESHECLRPGVTQSLINRFNESHEIVLIHDNGQRYLNQAPDWFNGLAHLDQLLATWEWRSGPTPWLVMTSKTKAQKI